MVFSPTDPDKAVLIQSKSIHTLKQDSFGGKTWGGQHRLSSIGPLAGTVCTFNSDGKTVVLLNQNDFREYNPTTLSYLGGSTLVSHSEITGVICCPIKPGRFVVGNQQGELELYQNLTLVACLCCMVDTCQSIQGGFLHAHGHRTENGLRQGMVLVISFFGMQLIQVASHSRCIYLVTNPTPLQVHHLPCLQGGGRTGTCDQT